MSSITPKPGMTVEISMQGIEKSRLDAIEAAESLRKANEAKRTEAETARANAEALRRQTFEANEANRHTAFESAESARESEWTEIKSNVESSVGSAVASASAATDAANTAADNANAAAEKSVRYDVAQKISDAQKAQARENIESASEAYVNELKSDVAAITPDDTVVDGKPWTSKKTVDSLCMPLEATGNPVQVYPVEGYPLGVKVSWGPVQAGEGDPSPENIRPISGRDAVSVTKCGKNLFGVGIANVFIAQGGSQLPLEGAVTTPKIPCKAGDKFILTCKNTFAPAPGNIGVIAYFDASDALLNRVENTSSNQNTLTAPENASYVLASCYAPTEEDEIVFEIGSTDTPYEPYTGDTYDIALPETVYGGEVDAVTGEGIKNWKRVVFDGAENWNKRAVNYTSYSLYLPRRAQTGFCTHFKKILYDAIRPDTATGETGCYLEFSTTAIFNVPFENVDDWKNYLAAQYAAGTPVYIVFQYANKVNEPFTVTGTQPIPALSGVNTLYTDAGTLTVTGREDPRHTIVELKNAIISLGGNI